MKDRMICNKYIIPKRPVKKMQFWRKNPMIFRTLFLKNKLINMNKGRC